jgi:hypothetical protein
MLIFKMIGIKLNRFYWTKDLEKRGLVNTGKVVKNRFDVPVERWERENEIYLVQRVGVGDISRVLSYTNLDSGENSVYYRREIMIVEPESNAEVQKLIRTRTESSSSSDGKLEEEISGTRNGA